MKRTYVVLTLILTLALLLIGCRGGPLPLSAVLTITNSNDTDNYYVKISEPAGSTTTLVITDGNMIVHIPPSGSDDFNISWLGSAAGESQFVDMVFYLDDTGSGAEEGDGYLEVIAGQNNSYDLINYFK